MKKKRLFEFAAFEIAKLYLSIHSTYSHLKTVGLLSKTQFIMPSTVNTRSFKNGLDQ